MAHNLNGKKIAILVENGFEQIELTDPKQALEEAGARTQIVSPQEGRVKGWQKTDWGDEFKVDVPLENARAEEYDGLRDEP
jgi:protease I